MNLQLLISSLSSIFYNPYSSIKLGVNIRQSIETLQNDKPHIVVGTPGRILDLANRGALDLSKVLIILPSKYLYHLIDQTFCYG